ncbi:hypothetical protein I3760_04G055200 [Carya illinoinensis]|nr:hypothetical protein I3760_04G055200 [Carya illinoinensis]
MGSSSSFSSVIKWHSFHKPMSSLLILKLFLLLWAFFPPQSAVVFADSDKSVLLQFKTSVSDPSGLLSTWASDSSKHCSWFGVSCDLNSRVVSLNVTGNGRQGNSCSDFAQYPLYGFGVRTNCLNSRGKLVGKLLPMIAKLSELRILSLPFNGFDGEIPGEVWGMEKLEVLDLEGNSVTGSLPVQFGGIPSSLLNCATLEILNLAGNDVNGTVPAFVGGFRVVYLSFNRLTGAVPSEIGDHCGKLEQLDLSGNFLFHGIPRSLGNCSQLQSLLLYSNMLEEVIPAELGQLQKLQVLDVSRNTLSGSLPSELGNCSELSILVLSNLFEPLSEVNNRKRDSLSDQFGSKNDDFNYFQLRVLWAPRATLEGRFPSSWGACKNFEMINLAQNFFIGEVPDALSHCKKLHFLDISSNRLTGKLVEGLPVPCMTVFDVSGNALSGIIPRFNDSTCPPVPYWNGSPFEADSSLCSRYLSFFTLKAQVEAPSQSVGVESGIAVFHNFRHNNFTGTIQSMPIAPERLGKQTVYTFLAGENLLTGPFPGNIFEKCGGLNTLIVNVSNNKISGQIPATFGKMCKSLKLFDASVNQITGHIPPSFGELSLVALNLSGNLLHGQIPTNLSQTRDLKYLSLAGNNLTGFIPSSLGQLHYLEKLDLSSNSLTGEIPEDLVNLKHLTLLLLNNNNLSGRIPAGLANVTTLSAFNVSYNNLSGSVPVNNSLMNCSSVLGNPYLRSCPMFSLAASSSDPRGGDSNPESYTAASAPGVPSQGAQNSGLNSIEIASITSASAIVSVLLALIVLFFYTRKWSPKSRVIGSVRKEVTVFTDIGVQLSFENVVRATGNFNASNCIGNGGFGATYKAEISPGILVAIKRLAVGRFQGIQQFHAEIKTLGRLRHPNLVTLIGYHASETEMFLIYNYLPGGNLEKFIQERTTRAVDWRILHKIALDIARALAYLHDQCVPRVLHRDVKPSNILLDDDFNAYLSDFGLARLLGTSETHATTGVAGTFGYVAPEYAMTCRVSDKADVYSYGVVLLELLSDKKALDPSFSSYGNGFNIVAWACMQLRQGRAKEFFTAGLWDGGPHDDLVEVLHLAVVCTVDSLSTRPTMKQVVRRLKQLQPPSC